MTIIQVFWQFVCLGLTSFGGPAAHLGYFQRVFVERLQWLTPEQYAQVVSLSQILPGPGSSQAGFAIGLHRAGLLGGLAAFLGFTLPSFGIMYWLAVSADLTQSNDWLMGAVYGLKLLAVIVVFKAIRSMAKSFCFSPSTVVIAILTAAALLVVSHPAIQLITIVSAALFGLCFLSGGLVEAAASSQSKSSGVWPLVLMAGLFALSFTPFNHQFFALFSDFYQAGSLVFGGGHVVLPLLQDVTSASINDDSFMFGYAAAQGVPGPMFTLATFLGAQLLPDAPLLGAVLATCAIFLPGLLLMLAFFRGWQDILANPRVKGAATGINAAVVGLLIAAFYNPVVQTSVTDFVDVIIVVLGWIALRFAKLHILALMLGCSLAGMGRMMLFP